MIKYEVKSEIHRLDPSSPEWPRRILWWLVVDYGSGVKLQLPLSHLEHTPFNDYRIPGLVLFTVNGVFSLLTLLALLFNLKIAPKLVILQGLLLAGWIIIQVIMIRSVNWMHWMYWGVGMLLMAIGYLLQKQDTIVSIPNCA